MSPLNIVLRFLAYFNNREHTYGYSTNDLCIMLEQNCFIIQIYKEYPSLCQYKHLAAAVGLTDKIASVVLINS